MSEKLWRRVVAGVTGRGVNFRRPPLSPPVVEGHSVVQRVLAGVLGVRLSEPESDERPHFIGQEQSANPDASRGSVAVQDLLDSTAEPHRPSRPVVDMSASGRDPGGLVLPAYVVVDESGSMGPYRSDLDHGLASLVESLGGEPLLAARLRLTVLGFSDDVQVRLAGADLRMEVEMPVAVIRGVTNYGEVFSDLLFRIPADVRSLRASGYKVHRPVVFFLSDGQPTDGQAWRRWHSELTDKSLTSAAPSIIAVGVAEAQAGTMLDVATRPEFAFVARQGTDVGIAISGFFSALTSSLSASIQGFDSSAPQLVVNRPEQFAMAIDEI